VEFGSQGAANGRETCPECSGYPAEYRTSELRANDFEPLWEQENANLQFLYVIGIAAGKSGRQEIQEKALDRLLRVGNGSPELHFLLGKGLLPEQR
jgi:hypothetical protein